MAERSQRDSQPPAAHGAPVVIARPEEDPSALLAALGLAPDEPRPVIVVCGGADELKEPELSVVRAILGPAVGAAARATNAAVVDGGTAAGVMALVGAERARDRAALPVLIGVAPAGQVAHGGPRAAGRTELESNHTHFVLADSGEWGGETALLTAIAKQVACGAPIAMVLAGGGGVARGEAADAVARGWPVFVIEGTGGAADAIAALWRSHREPRRRHGARLLPARMRVAPTRAVRQIADPVLRRIVNTGDVRPVAPVDASRLSRPLAWELSDDTSLKDAWLLFATYDALAGALRRTFERVQTAILLLGILATLLALVHSEVGTATLHWLVVAAPIVLSVLVAVANRRAAGKRWVLLRAAAESTKSEIFRYRTRTGVYSDEGEPPGDLVDRRRRLAAQIEAIEAKLVETDASSGPLTPYHGPLPPAMYGAAAADDGLSAIDAERYIRIRIADQLSYYRGRVDQLDRRRAVLQTLTVGAGGAGALLAAAGLEIWIGLTTALSAAALAHLGHMQVDNTIVAYNRSAAQLAGLEREFRAGSARALSPEVFHHLVTRGEAVLTMELGGWVQQMTEAVERQQTQQSEGAARAGEPAREPSGSA